jgi:hypothetical protein
VIKTVESVGAMATGVRPIAVEVPTISSNISPVDFVPGCQIFFIELVFST